MRHGSIVEFLFDDSRASAAEPTIVHLNQMLHTSFARAFPGLSFALSRASPNSPAGKEASQSPWRRRHFGAALVAQDVTLVAAKVEC